MFYLTLPSNSSFDHFPNNTLSEYTTKLPQEINLEEFWEVGVAEIGYPHTWYNISREGEYWLRYEYKHRIVRVTLLPGFYGSSKDIVDELMKGLRLYYGMNLYEFVCCTRNLRTKSRIRWLKQKQLSEEI